MEELRVEEVLHKIVRIERNKGYYRYYVSEIANKTRDCSSMWN